MEKRTYVVKVTWGEPDPRSSYTDTPQTYEEAEDTAEYFLMLGTGDSCKAVRKINVCRHCDVSLKCNLSKSPCPLEVTGVCVEQFNES